MLKVWEGPWRTSCIVDVPEGTECNQDIVKFSKQFRVADNLFSRCMIAEITIDLTIYFWKLFVT